MPSAISMDLQTRFAVEDPHETSAPAAKSPRMKSVKIRLQLDPREAKQDRWKWNVIFLKRDPLAALQE